MNTIEYTTNLDLGRSLKELRKEKGLSARDVAELLGVSLSVVYFMEKGTSPVTEERREKLEELYEVSFQKVERAEKPVEVEMEEDKKKEQNIVFYRSCVLVKSGQIGGKENPIALFITPSREASEARIETIISDLQKRDGSWLYLCGEEVQKLFRTVINKDFKIVINSHTGEFIKYYIRDLESQDCSDGILIDLSVIT